MDHINALTPRALFNSAFSSSSSDTLVNTLDFWLKLRLDNNHCSLLIVKFISVDLINTQKNDVFQKCQHIKDCYFINLSQKFNLFLLEAIAETFGEDGSYGEIYIPIVVP